MILWKNIDFKNKGIIVETTPIISKPKKRIDAYNISGRNGVLIVDNGTYDSFTASVECHFDLDRFTLEDIMEYLDGYGSLSFDGVKQYSAYIKNAIPFEKVQNFKKFVIQFECNPIAEEIASSVFEVENTTETFNISKATTNMNPIIVIKGTGDVSITFNNKTFYLYDLVSSKTYTLDCEAKEIIDNNGINCSNLMSGEFPYLKKGNNTIEYQGTITKFTITYKKAFV